MHGWEDWLVIVPSDHQFADQLPQKIDVKLWSKTEFQAALETKLLSGAAINSAPFWVAFSPEQNARNVLVKSGKDVSWPILTSNGKWPVISAFKLLKRWRDAEIKLPISPLW